MAKIISITFSNLKGEIETISLGQPIGGTIVTGIQFADQDHFTKIIIQKRNGNYITMRVREVSYEHEGRI